MTALKRVSRLLAGGSVHRVVGAPLGACLSQYLLDTPVVGMLPVVGGDEGLELRTDRFALLEVEAALLGEGREVLPAGLEGAVGAGIEAVHQGPVGGGAQASECADTLAKLLDARHLGIRRERVVGDRPRSRRTAPRACRARRTTASRSVRAGAPSGSTVSFPAHPARMAAGGVPIGSPASAGATLR